MTRWRPPSPAASPYITPEGYKNLESELQELWKKRAEVTKALAAAAAEGDRSENAEYIYRKKELREIDRRIAYLQKRMPKLKVVNKVGDSNKVFFGALVTVEDVNGKESSWHIVGADEIEDGKNHISVDSPMAKALLGKAVDDEVIVKTEGKARSYIVTVIKYK